MEDDIFHMPNLHGLTTKPLQLGTLCTVRLAAVQSFKSLNDEEQRLRALLLRNGKHRGYLKLQRPSPDYQPQHNNSPYGSIDYQLPSLTEDTLQRYGSLPMADNPHLLPIHVGADGKSYPFNPDNPNYTSLFPIGFK